MKNNTELLPRVEVGDGQIVKSSIEEFTVKNGPKGGFRKDLHRSPP